MNTIELNVQGMSCGSCVKHVNAALSQLAGVTAVEVDLSAGSVRVTGFAGTDALVSALDHAGYPAQIVTVASNDAKPVERSGKGGCCCR